MKINWKLRLKNKTTLISLVGAVITLVYQILAMCGIVPKIEQSVIENVALSVIGLLCILGIVVDPTTQGVSDSNRALNYTEPNKDEETKNE